MSTPYKLQKSKAEITERQMDDVGYLHCENCGSSCGPFNDHHIIYRSEARNHKEVHNIQNLIRVCASPKPNNCHDWFHSRKANREELVEERNLKQLFNE